MRPQSLATDSTRVMGRGIGAAAATRIRVMLLGSTGVSMTRRGGTGDNVFAIKLNYWLPF